LPERGKIVYVNYISFYWFCSVIGGPMQHTTDMLALKYREGISLFLKVLTGLGLTRRAIANQLGVTPAIVSYWERTERRITTDNAIKVYGVFVDAIMAHWPEDDVTRQQWLLPLLGRCTQVWLEASELRTKQADEELNALLFQCVPTVKKHVRSVAEWYQVEAASAKVQQLITAVREHDEIADAWRTAQATVEQIQQRSKAPDESPAGPQAQRQRTKAPHRTGKRAGARG
jgi:transcriptional regulator with XRE-family HTH domain